MKVLYVTMQFGRGYAQGTERYLTILSAGLRERGHESVVLAADPEHRGPDAALGEQIEASPRVLAYPSYGWMAVGGLPVDQLSPLLRDLAPDLIHVANPGHVGANIISAGTQAGIPVVATVMDYWWLCPKHTLRHYEGRICDARVPWHECMRCIAVDREQSIRKPLARVPVLRSTLLPLGYFAQWAFRGVPTHEIANWTRRQRVTLGLMNRATAVIYPSSTARRLIAPRLSGPAAHPIPYGLEPHWFAAGSDGAADTPPPNRDDRTIGYAGALAPHKGPDLLLEALHKLGWTRVRVRIAGGGDDERYVAQLHALAEGLNVEFVGRVKPADMPAFMRTLDVMVIPSLWPENLPIIVLEGYASRRPVLASNVGGIEEIIATPAHLFDVGSADSLAACLRRWDADPSLPALPRVSTADEMVAQTVGVYESILAQRAQ